MKKARFTDNQIMSSLKQAEAGTPVVELCREHGMSNASFYTAKIPYIFYMCKKIKHITIAIFTPCRKDGYLMLLRIHINNIIQTSLQFIHVVCIPLHHFSSSIHILSMIIRTTDRILVNIRKLSFNPR